MTVQTQPLSDEARAIERLARDAKAAAHAVASLPTETKNAVLLDLAGRLQDRRDDVIAANAEDMDAARASGLATAKLRRLEITAKGVDQMAEGLRQIAAMPDPVGAVSKSWTTPEGLNVEKVRTPLGVIAMIYEARPNVTIDAFSLCFKAGNACMLKGGREANASNTFLAALARESLTAHGAPEHAINAITTSDRDAMRHMLTLDDALDLVIPRGGETLIRFVHEHSRVPTVQHFHGVCHIYVDAEADLDAAINICLTAKTSGPATCNAAECLLVHKDVAERFIPEFAKRCAEAGVELRGDDRTRALASGVNEATDADWGHEYLDLILACRVVDSLDDAIAHIAAYGSNHTEAILTTNDATAEAFTHNVHSSCVLVNASTRFNDGFQLGLGAEIGISTSRVHAYGPMGLAELTIERYVVRGKNHAR